MVTRARPVRKRKQSRALREAMAIKEVISISDDSDDEDLRSSDGEFKSRK